MKITSTVGVVGQPAGVHWGTAPDGSPVLLIVGSGVTTRVDMTATEAKDHGASACYIAIASALAAPSSGEGVRASSLLVSASGGPLGAG